MSYNEPLAKSAGANTILLKDHLCQVADYARAVTKAYRTHWERLLGQEWAEYIGQAIVLAALAHDLGKAADGFQQSLHHRQYRWEFRHEVLSAAVLLASAHPDNPAIWLAIAAILTHHRHLDDPQLRNDSGLPAIPEPDILHIAQQKFRDKANELQGYWGWLQAFCIQHPELQPFHLPNAPSALQPPNEFLEHLAQQCSSLFPLQSNANRDNHNGAKAVALMLTRGWLMASDHAASAGVTEFKIDLPALSPPSPRSFQKQVGAHKGDAFLEAPTGSGKTLAALLWALHNRHSGERIFYLLPYQASIEAMAKTLEQYFGSDHVAVLHARAIDYAFSEYFEQVGEYEAAAAQATVEAELNRLVHKPLKVATPFQLLKWLFGVPRWEIGISEMVEGLFIFDEIHAYDAHTVALIVEMVRVLKPLGGRFLFMSATFPPFLKGLLKNALSAQAAEFALEPADNWSEQFLSQARHHLQWHDHPLESLVPQIVHAAKQGKRVLVVANRVAQSQELYRQLGQYLGECVHLLHSRFTRRDRVSKEQDIIGALRGEKDLNLQVLVATQVVEVSLDVSFDTIFTEVAPVDDLLQRFGRVNRFGEHRDGVEVHVARQFDAERLQWVYHLERIDATLHNAPNNGTSLTVPTTVEWVKQVYQNGWTENERKRFDTAQAAFRQIIRSLRPLHCAPEGEAEFYGLFQSVEVLPSGLYNEYETHRRNRHYLLANQLLLPVPLGTFWMLQKAGRLTKLKDGTLKTDVVYDDKLGLLPDKIDIDSNFI